MRNAMELDRSDIEALQDLKSRVRALEEWKVSNTSLGRWFITLLVSAIAAFAGALAEVALRK